MNCSEPVDVDNEYHSSAAAAADLRDKRRKFIPLRFICDSMGSAGVKCSSALLLLPYELPANQQRNPRLPLYNNFISSFNILKDHLKRDN